VKPAELHRMCETMVHRGPNDEGFYTLGHVGLGVRRLSVIDLDHGHQPAHNEDEAIVTVLNGEIYNFGQLREELARHGHHFSNRSDTEIIPHLYEEFGLDCVDQLRGMFAFAVYDARRDRLLLARDRFGKKPLYYATDNDAFYFSSEIKAILAVAPHLAEVDVEALMQFFCFNYIPDPGTIFKKIRKLPPGHLLEHSRGLVHVKRYWNLPAYGTHEFSSEEECLQELERQLTEAVSIRLAADVPLGAVLSGGTDSATVVAIMSRLSSKPIQTFSVGFAERDFDERPYARRVAQRFDTEHHEMVVEPSLGEDMERLTGMLDEPFADNSVLPTYYLSRLCREHVTVVLSGDGGDELFAGYDRHQLKLQPRNLDHLPEWAGRLYYAARNHVNPRVAHLTLSGYLNRICFVPDGGRERSLFSAAFQESIRDCADPLNLFRLHMNQAPSSDRLGQLLYLDTKTYLPGSVLAKVDRMSMAASLEVRAPFLDHVFAEMVIRMPSRWKIQAGQEKYILKKLAERLGVPREAVYRPKQGFTMPMGPLLRNGIQGELPAILLEPRTIERGYFDPRALRKLVEDHIAGKEDHSVRLFQLLMFELWHRNFLQPFIGTGSSQSKLFRHLKASEPSVISAA
jgi:asparagine synthase (glutamine-hydrolysing)